MGDFFCTAKPSGQSIILRCRRWSLSSFRTGEPTSAIGAFRRYKYLFLWEDIMTEAKVKPALFLFVVFVILFANCLVSTKQKPEPKPDVTPPTLMLEKGKDTIFVGDKWEEPGYHCYDSVDGNLNDSVRIFGVVDSTVEGVTIITYSAADTKGNSVTEKRTVTVLASPDLWAQYQLNGNGDDASGNGRNAKIVGNVPVASDRFESAGGASQFNGSEGNYILYDNIKGFKSGNCPKTLSGWVKTASSGNQAFFGIGGTTEKYNFQVAAGDGIRVNGWGNDNDWRTGISRTAVCDGKWHHLAITYDSAKTVFYLDGVKKAETSAFKFFTDTAKGKVVIGNEIDFAGWPVNGLIDDVRVYARSLTAPQISALYRIKGWSASIDTSTPPDTATPPDTTTPPDTIKLPEKVTGLSYQIKGAAGSLSLVLEWTNVSSALSYGVYYDNGKTVDKNGYYRVASKNTYTFVGALQEGAEYTFAVTSLGPGGSESKLSDPITVLFKAP
jgi:hypothetical protein